MRFNNFMITFQSTGGETSGKVSAKTRIENALRKEAHGEKRSKSKKDVPK